MLYARPNVITRTAAAAATRLRICFRFVFEPAAAGVFSSQAAACVVEGTGATAFDHALGFTLKYPCPNECP